MKILSKQNFNQNESKNFVVDNLSSAPSNPILGQVYYNTKDERAYVCIKAGKTPEWADLSLQEEVSIGGEEPNGRDIKIWINPEDITASNDYGSLPIGSIIPYSGETAPEGYSICDGKELNRETYKELFSIIGTTFGNGDGSSTFNLPDLKGRVSVGVDNSDTDFNTLGKVGGEKTHTLTISEMPSHTHKPSTSQYGQFTVHSTSTAYGTPDLAGGSQAYNAYVNETQPTGGSQAHNNLQPYIVLNYIIKIYGEAMLTGDVIDSLEGDSSYNAPSIHAVNTKIKELEAYSSTAINEGSEITLDPNPNPNYNPINIQINGKSEQTATNGTNLIGLDNNQYKVDLKIGDKICVTNNGTTQLNLNLYTNYGDTARNDYFTIYANSKRIVSVSKDAKAIAWGGTIEGLAWVNKGEEQLPYEEYTGGQPSPNPDYPQEIKSVSGVNSLLKNTNVNSGDGNYWSVYSTFDEATRTLTRSTTATTESFITHMINNLKSNTTYTLFLEAKSNGYVKNMDLHCYNKSVQGHKYETRLNLSTEFKKYSFTFTTDKDVDYSEETIIRIDNNGSTTSGIEAILTVKNVTLVEGTYNSYVPYGHWLAVTNTGKNSCEITSLTGYQFSNALPVVINTNFVITEFDSNNFSYSVASNSYLLGLTNIFRLKPNTNYTLSFTRTDTGISSGRCYIYNVSNDGTYTVSQNCNGTGSLSKTFTTGDNGLIALGIGVGNNSSGGSGTVNNIQIEEGTQATPYELYQEQSMLIDMNKPNLFDKDNVILDKGINTNTGALYSSDTQFSTDYINIENIPSISTNGVSNTSNQIYGALYDENKTYLASIFSSTSNLKINNLSAVYVRLTFLNEYLDSLEIYEGFKPYYELCSDDTTKDELGIDKEGNVYVTQNIGEDVLNGSESWVMPSSTTLPNMFQISTNINLSKYGSDGSNSKALSNYFINGNTQNVRTTDGFVLFTQSNVNYIRIVNTNISTVADFKTWLSTHPVTVKYALAEPQTISLGKITPLKLLEGTNNITTNDELQPNMKIEYYTDVMGNPGVIPDYDGLPVGSEIDFDGTEIPDGFVQVDDPNTYSSEEVVIGIWFGKKLYRKSFRFNELATGTNNIVHGIDNLNEITNAYGSCKRNDDKIQPVPRVDASELGWQIGITDVDTQSFQLYVGTRYNGASKIKNGNVTLEYTKTTD